VLYIANEPANSASPARTQTPGRNPEPAADDGLGGAEPGLGQGVQGGLGRGRELAEALGQVAVQVQERVREQFPRIEAAAVSGQDAAEQARVAARDEQAEDRVQWFRVAPCSGRRVIVMSLNRILR